MEKKKEYIKLWLSYESYFEPYSDVEVGRLVRAMMKYKSSGAAPEFTGSERFIWPAIKREIDEDIASQAEASRKNSINGSKGGRPRKAGAFEEEPENQPFLEESEKSDRFFEKPKKAIEKDKEKVKEKEKELPASSIPPPSGTQAAGGTIGPYPVKTRELYAYFEENCNVFNARPVLNAITNCLLEGVAPEVVTAIIDETVLAGARSPAAYAVKIMDDILAEQVRDLSAYQARSAKFKKQKEQKSNGTGRENHGSDTEAEFLGGKRY